MALPTRPRVVIIGGGFGGLYAARALGNAPVDVTLIDRTNHHVFQPLLYQVATATLSPADIAAPIRWLLHRQRNTEVLLGEVTAIDPRAQTVTVDGLKKYNYDYIIIAAGARHAYFGHDDWERLAPGLKSIDDATELRRRWLMAFERAERTDDPAVRAANLTFVVVGGGPTGVELAGMLPTIARLALPQDFRRIDTTAARIILIEGGPRLLPAFPDELSEVARRDLVELGVEVRLNTLVTEVGDGYVRMGDERLDAGTVFWAAGNAAAAIGASLGVERDRAGRVIVQPDLSVREFPNVFIVGDMAAMTSRGRPVPAVAPAAMQSGRTAARNVLHSLRREPREPFRYRNKGDLATIGRYRAVGVLAGRNLSGPLAWWTWLLVHIMYLAGFRNRVSVLIEWGYSFFTYQRGARLITASAPPPTAREPLPPKW
jgi:NADH dehydrogenase